MLLFLLYDQDIVLSIKHVFCFVYLGEKPAEDNAEDGAGESGEAEEAEPAVEQEDNDAAEPEAEAAEETEQQ